MKIEYLGHSCFCIENNAGIKLVTDPYSRVGYQLPNNLTAQAVTVSHDHFDHNHTDAVKYLPIIISSVGEYNNVCGMKIAGKHSWHDPEQGRLRGGNIIFTMEVDGITVCHFGDLGEMDFKKMEPIVSNADVWLIPVGGTYTINAEQAKQYIEKFKPKMVIPMHYRPYDGTLDISSVNDFLSKFNPSEIITCPSGVLTVGKEDLKKGKTKIVYMERKR